MARPKSPTHELLTREAAEEALRDMLTAQVELEKLQGDVDLKVARAHAGAEPAINAHRSRIADLEAQLQTWFMTRAAREPGSKSIRLAHGVVGERTGQPTLKPLNAKWSWKAIGAKLAGEYGGRFFHAAAAPMPDKDKIRAEMTPDQLRECGMRVFQDERFYVELDRTSLGDK